MKPRFPWLPVSLAVWISACASLQPLPEAKDAVRDLYWKAVPGEAAAPMPQPLPDRFAPADRFSESVDRQLLRDFEELPNPRLVLYVHPHFAADGTPIPGYATWFRVFEQARILRLRN